MNIQWEAGKYTENFDFVHRYGESVLELVEAEAGGLVVDLGCGNGALTQKLADRGYRVLGVDDSAEMVAEARALHPGLPFQKGDAVTFQLEEKADVIFSNAVLHWIDGSRRRGTAWPTGSACSSKNPLRGWSLPWGMRSSGRRWRSCGLPCSATGSGLWTTSASA